MATPPRAQDLIVLTSAWMARLPHADCSRQEFAGRSNRCHARELEATDEFKAFRRQVAKLAGAAKLSTEYTAL